MDGPVLKVEVEIEVGIRLVGDFGETDAPAERHSMGCSLHLGNNVDMAVEAAGAGGAVGVADMAIVMWVEVA